MDRHAWNICLWLYGKAGDKDLIGPWPVFWWARLAKIVIFLSGCYILLEVLGEEKVRAYERRMRENYDRLRQYDVKSKLEAMARGKLRLPIVVVASITFVALFVLSALFFLNRAIAGPGPVGWGSLFVGLFIVWLLASLLNASNYSTIFFEGMQKAISRIVFSLPLFAVAIVLKVLSNRPLAPKIARISFAFLVLGFLVDMMTS